MEVLHPLVYWAQTKDKITLKVDLSDVSSPKIDIKENELSFKGYGQGAKGLHEYEFQLELNDDIDIEKSAYRISGRHIDFNLYKVTEGAWWDRLTKKKTRLAWLRIDFDRWRNEYDSSGKEDDDDPTKDLSPEQMEHFDKLGKDIMAEKDKAYSDIKNMYLFFYNLFQFSAFAYTFMYMLQRYAVHGKDEMKEAFDRTIISIGIAQLFSMLELVHAFTGLVKSNLMATLMQVMGRNLLLFAVILPAEPLHTQPMVCYLFLVWSAVELVRYPFYAFGCMDLEFETLTWLRYTVWIPLYPLGFLTEVIVILLALPHYKDSGQNSLSLPNQLNFAFYFPYYLYFHIFSIVIGGISQIRYMWRSRKKRLAVLFSSAGKEKMS